jgi:hypothetical protein
MTLALSELSLGFSAAWLSPSSKSYRPESWPPPRDWVVAEDRLGRVISRWGDPVWDFSPLAGRALKLNFGDGAEGRTARIDPDNADLFRLAMTWLIWGTRSVKAVSTLHGMFHYLRPIFVLCSQEGIRASDLGRFPRVLEQIPALLSPSVYSSVIYRLHTLLDAKDKLGFVLVDAAGLKRLAAAAPGHEGVQTAYIPPRIWTYQITRLKECLDDYLAHRQAVEDCFNFCVDAYAENYGSLTAALTPPSVGSRLPFQTARTPTAGRRAGIRYHGPFQLTAARFGIEELLTRWIEPMDGRLELRQLSAYLSLVQWVGTAYTANFTLQRIEEATSLRADCLQFEDDEKLGRVPVICGDTTKTLQDSDARWPTSPSVQTAVDALRSVARMRVRCAQASPFFVLTADEVANPYLFLRSSEPWAPRPRGHDTLLTKQAHPYLSTFTKHYPKVFDVKELTITEEDLRVAQRLTPNLPEAEFAVGQVWPLAWHQLRRTGAVNMFASGLLSDASMQYLMKHSSRVMPLYYGRGYSQLHLNEEVAGLVTAAMYEVMAKSMLSAMGDRFVSSRSAEQKQVSLVNLLGNKDAKELAAAGRRGEVFFRETRLGACTSRAACTYGGIESVARCAGGDGAKPCGDALFDHEKAPAVEKDLIRVNQALACLPVDSPRHQALLQERQGLENFLNVINKP